MTNRGLHVVAWLVLAPSLLGQTDDEVRLAVLLSVSDTESREQLAAWGNEALPVVRVMIEEANPGNAQGIVMALGAIATPEAVDVLLSLAEESEARTLFLVLVGAMVPLSDDLKQNMDRDRLRDVVIPLLESQEHWMVLDTVLDLAEVFAWSESVEAIRPLLHHENGRIRGKAAELIGAWTGETPELPPALTAFPAERLDEDLVELIGIVPEELAHSGGMTFAAWPEDVPHLLYAVHGEDRDRTLVLDEFLETVAELPTVGRIHDYCVVPRAGDSQERQLVTFARRVEGHDGVAVVAFDTEGRELWRHQADDGYGDHLVTLHKDGQVIGVAFVVDGLAMAVDLAGELLWSRPGRTYVVRTHEELDVVALCAGTVRLVDALVSDGGEGIRSAATEVLGFDPGLLLFAFDGTMAKDLQLFPETGERSAYVVVGRDHLEDVDRVWRRGRETWTATVSDEVSGLRLMEPEGEPRLFVAFTRAGEVLVFDEHGTLLWKRTFPESSFWRFSQQSLEAGRLGGAWAFAVPFRGEVRVYRLRERDG